MNKISLLYWEKLTGAELNIIKMIGFLGGSVRSVNLRDAIGRAADGPFVTPGTCLITSAQTFATFRKQLREAGSGQADLGANLFIYGFEPVPGHRELLEELTAGDLIDIESAPAIDWRINVASEPICRQLSGLSFDVRNTDGRQYTFKQAKAHERCVRLLSIGQSPFCVRIQDERFEAMIVAGGEVPDLDAILPPAAPVMDAFVGLAPLLMFLHRHLHQHLWHNDSPGACFIVDDPLLKRRYGHLEYQKLQQLMDRERFSASVAFIPWNCKRSKRSVVELLARSSFSLCVHGCDHTWGEFGGDDLVELRQKARQALERMREHHSLSGLDFDDVMVFPQGIFSTSAMSALKSCGYLSAVNSTVVPVNADRTLTMRDLLSIAVTRYSNFPLFTRWYPDQTAEIAFNLFLGKPALLVEHHGFFRDGYGALAETIENLNRLEPHLQWANPAAVCSRACWKRVAEDGSVDVLFFTDRFTFQNETSQPQRYTMIRYGLHEPDVVVTVNNQPAENRQASSGMSVELLLDAGEVAEIRIEGGKPEPVNQHVEPQLRYRANVFVRRVLTEFRDNYLDLNPFVRRAMLNRRG